MKVLNQIQFLVLLSTSQIISGQFGQAIISEQPRYESYNIYWPHDNFMLVHTPGRYLDNPVTLKFEKDGLTIENKIADGFTGHSIYMHLSSEFEITEVKYNEWTDVYDGSYSEYIVEKIILSLDKNPFKEKYLAGHYIIQIRENYFDGWLTNDDWILNPKGNKTSYKIFHGKFKIYTEDEINKKKHKLDSLNTRERPQPSIIDNSTIMPFKGGLKK
jgi:hypothetical protein